MTPRQIWFKNRIIECIEELQRINAIEDWIMFKNKAHDLAKELMYATSEWDKFYLK